MNNSIAVIGLDLAKNVFQLHAVDAQGHTVLKKTLKRQSVAPFFANLSPCLVGMESCASSHYWARELTRYGHEVRLMAPLFVKAYLKGNKNDANDAEAICEAVQRPSMRFVTIKMAEQQAILQLHKARRGFMQQKVALVNQMRAFLLEHGIAIPRGIRHLIQAIPEYLEDADNNLPDCFRHLLILQKQHYDHLVEQIHQIEVELEQWHKSNLESQRLAKIPGVGLLGATALAATVGDAKNFHNGRQLSAFLGLVPKQYSSGGRERLLGISKRGDAYIRSLLVHGARSVIYHVRRRMRAGEATKFHWVEKLLQKQKHVNKVAVALANKIARVAWVLLNRKENYRIIEQQG